MEERESLAVLDATAPGNGLQLWLFTVTIFIGATLLFLVQPLFAKMVLPLLGGSPSVWNTAMVFFQTILLAGYGYAHWLMRRLGQRNQIIVHLCVLALAALVLPIGVGLRLATPRRNVACPLAAGPAHRFGRRAILCRFRYPPRSSSAGLRGPGHPHAHDPYFLYSAE